MKTTKNELKAIAAALQELEYRKLNRQIDFYTPYPKQMEFHNLGLTKRERLLMAGNRVGKTYCGAFEMSCHLTGDYPEWWLGKRFDRPIKAWAANDTGTSTRDVVQTKLCGPYAYPAKYGTGMIPKAAVNWTKDVSLARGVTDLFDTVLVSHVSGSKSILTFKTYEQGPKKWQGEAVDVIWFDEEPPEDVFAEGMARIAPTDVAEEGGICYVTFTPLMGKSKVVLRFTDEYSPDRSVTRMTMDDAKHINAEAKAKILSGYLSWQRAAREKGTPLLGSGAIFITPESDLIEQRPFDLPAHWWYGWGIDFGIGHPFAAVLMGWDKDADVIHILHTIRMEGKGPLHHAAAMKPYLGTAPVSWPQDGHQREKGSTEHLYVLYKKQGLKMMSHHATHVDGSNGTEAGIIEQIAYMDRNGFKVSALCGDWFEEYRDYHRKDGLIVKERDDLMSATRVGFMMRRYFKQMETMDPWGIKPRQKQALAIGVDTECWGA